MAAHRVRARELARAVDGLTALAIASNLGKRSLCLDARTPAGRAIVARLATQADVLIENFRPRVMARLGLAYETLAADNPRLIYLSISGFVDSGPWADKPGTDSGRQAYTGMAVLNKDESGRPRRHGMLVADTIAALYAAQRVGAALYARSRTGLGEHVSLSLAECCAAFQAAPISPHASANERRICSTPDCTPDCTPDSSATATNERASWDEQDSKRPRRCRGLAGVGRDRPSGSRPPVRVSHRC